MEGFKEIRFPEYLATSVRQSKFHVIENRDISDPDDLHRLLRLLFDFPERSFYLFVQKQASLTDQLRQAVDSGDALITQTDLEFYPHPNFKHDYVRIRRGQESFDWEKEVVASATEYIRFTLVLSERKRRAMEIDLHIDAHSRKSANPLKLEPNIWGIGIDLKKVWAWLKSKRRAR